MRATARPYVAGTFALGHQPRLIVEPWDGSEVAWAASASPSDIDTALAASTEAPLLSPGARAQLLDAIAGHLAAHSDELADNLVVEAGKPLRAARREALRAEEIFRFAAAEVRHGTATADDYGVSARQAGSWGLVRRVPQAPSWPSPRRTLRSAWWPTRLRRLWRSVPPSSSSRTS